MAILSTESITGASSPVRPADGQCTNCGAPLAADQRYCLECGERRASVSDFLRSGPPAATSPPASPPGSSPPSASPGGSGSRNNALSLLAGVGVLLLAMGVGVLIGRSSSSARPSAPAAQVVTIGGGTGTGTATGGEESFSGDWPSGTKGYTVQLQTLPQTGTTVAAVDQAKSAATTKGAAAVGALKSEEFSSLTPGSYVIYSGVYHKRGEAEKALPGLKKSFPGAKVIEVSEGASSGASSSNSKSSGGEPSSSGGSVTKKAASPSVLEGLEHAKGKSYVEKSKNLPDVVSTG
ncbi:MAG: zinc ribbon domain-containing protein [Solirubrobacteraceae bacterium]